MEFLIPKVEEEAKEKSEEKINSDIEEVTEESLTDTQVKIDLVSELKNSKTFMEKFDEYNESIENALRIIEPYSGDFTGREQQLIVLRNVLRKKIHPFAMILGEAGMGKTTLVREFAKRVNSGQLEKKRRYVVLQLFFSNITALGTRAKKALENLLTNVKKLELLAQEVLSDENFHFIVYMDEVHLLINSISENSKSGGDTLKQSLTPSREEDVVRVVASTTRSEYDNYISTDEALKQRFTVIELPDFSESELKQLIQEKWHRMSGQTEILPADLIEKIIDYGQLYFSENKEPRRSETILENIIAWTEDKEELPSVEDLGQMLSDTHQLSSDNKVNIDLLAKNVNNVILGQEYAKFQIIQWAKGHNIEVGKRSGRPFGVFGFFGPTGVGKTEMAKQIGRSIHGEKGRFKTIKTPEYVMEEGGDNKLRKEIAGFVGHNPKAVVLIDEFEKGVYRKGNPINNNLLPLFLDITDEGRISYFEKDQDGKSVRLDVDMSQSVIIFTSNASHEVFEEREKFGDMDYDKSISNPTARSKRRDLDNQVQENLVKKYNFSPEFLGRMKKVYFENLTEFTAIQIAERKIKTYFEQQQIENGLTLTEAPANIIHSSEIRGAEDDFKASELAVFIGAVKSNMKDSSKGGARQINDVIKEELKDVLGEAVYDNPDVKSFEIYVARVKSDGTITRANTRGLLPQEVDVDQLRLEVVANA